MRSPAVRSRRSSGRLSALLSRALLGMQGALGLALGYLIALLLAARGALGRPDRFGTSEALGSANGRLGAPGQAEDGPPGAREGFRIVVLVPAHDEEPGIEATLASLAACDYPAQLRRTVVIADNCTDRTAARARVAGAEAWERVEPDRRGKGFALAWALERLQAPGQPAFDAVLMLDADCLVSPNLLGTVAEAMGRGVRAVQVNYEVGNPTASHASALRFAAFALMHLIRPAGKQRLGLSVGLFGTGIAFTAELLRREPWRFTGLVEDGEYHQRLVHVGERVEFLPGAWVRSAMPTSMRTSSVQQARWEKGKLELVRRWSPRLLVSGLAHRDPVRLHAALEPLVPPQSLIAAGSLGSALAGVRLGSRRVALAGVATLVAQLVFVLGGLRLAGAPRQVYRAMLAAPVLIAGKVVLYLGFMARRGPTSWVRTPRS